MILTTTAYDKLREAILSLELSPGEVLTERALETRLETSRTTVRAALARLENEGLVQREDPSRGGRGSIVAPIDLSEIIQACEFRDTIETASIRLACERATDTQLRHVQQVLEQQKQSRELETYMARATDFHLELARLSGNTFYARALEDVLNRLARTRWFTAGNQEGKRRAELDHARILEHLFNRDASAAEEEIRAHLTRSRDRLVNSLLAQQGLQLRGQIKK